MLTVGDRIPQFDLQAVVALEQDKAFARITDKSDVGKWKVIFFWPKDFTFVCPTEIAAFGRINKDFNERDTVVYGVSTDSEFVHLAWRQNHVDLKALPFAMLADLKRELSQSLGIIDKSEGVCLRATFIVDPEGIIRFVSVNDLSVGRNPQEVLRVLDAEAALARAVLPDGLLEGVEDEGVGAVPDRVDRELEVRRVGPADEPRQLLWRMEQESRRRGVRGEGLVEGGRGRADRAVGKDLEGPQADPVVAQTGAHAGRQERLVPLRMARMAASPFAFLRGAANVMAWDLAKTPSIGHTVMIDGDAHVSNFGLFRTPRQDVVPAPEVRPSRVVTANAPSSTSTDSSTSAAKAGAPVTITGCLEVDNDTFRLKDTTARVFVGVHLHVLRVDGWVNDDPRTTTEFTEGRNVNEDRLLILDESIDDVRTILENLVVHVALTTRETTPIGKNHQWELFTIVEVADCLCSLGQDRKTENRDPEPSLCYRGHK